MSTHKSWIFSNTVRMHHLLSLFKKNSSAVPNCFNYRHNAQFAMLVFNFFLQFQIVSNSITMHALDTLLSSISLKFPIVLNTMRMHALETFNFFLQFQTVSTTVKMHAWEILFSQGFFAVSNCFKYHQNICLRDIVFKRFSAVQNTVRLHA